MKIIYCILNIWCNNKNFMKYFDIYDYISDCGFTLSARIARNISGDSY